MLKTENPYRIFFPFSVAGALLGLSQFFIGYSGETIFWHREVMITLFLLPAACGFLFTAAPRFLVATAAQPAEVGITAGLFALLFISYFVNLPIVFIGLKLAAILSVVVFFGRRWWNRRTKNPYWPPFILTSMLTGLAGSAVQAIGRTTDISPELTRLGDQLFYDAMFWILLFGIGVKFFPMLTGAAPPVYRTDRRSTLTKSVYESNTLWYSIAILCLLSFLVQSLYTSAGLWMRAILLFFMAYEGWGILEKVQRKGITTNMLRMFLWTILVSHLIFPFFPHLLVHFYHVVFVVGFLSITTIVETRVMLSHEQLDMSAEQHSKWLLVAYILFFLAMVTRVIAVYMPSNYVNHLLYASAAAVTGLMIVIWEIWKAYRKKAIHSKFSG